MDFNKFLTNSEVVFHYSKEVASNAAKLAKVTAFSAIMLTTLVAFLPSSYEIQHKQQESISIEATNKLRNISYSYTTDVNGGLHEVCRDIGYGISAIRISSVEHGFKCRRSVPK